VGDKSKHTPSRIWRTTPPEASGQEEILAIHNYAFCIMNSAFIPKFYLANEGYRPTLSKLLASVKGSIHNVGVYATHYLLAVVGAIPAAEEVGAVKY